jgi:hypothetical protein
VKNDFCELPQTPNFCEVPQTPNFRELPQTPNFRSLYVYIPQKWCFFDKFWQKIGNIRELGVANYFLLLYSAKPRFSLCYDHKNYFFAVILRKHPTILVDVMITKIWLVIIHKKLANYFLLLYVIRKHPIFALG